MFFLQATGVLSAKNKQGSGGTAPEASQLYAEGVKSRRFKSQARFAVSG